MHLSCPSADVLKVLTAKTTFDVERLMFPERQLLRRVNGITALRKQSMTAGQAGQLKNVHAQNNALT